MGERLGVDMKTKSHCSLRLCLLHNKPLALTRHIGFFPRPAVFEPDRARQKAPCWTCFLCGRVSRLLFCPSWAYNAFSPQTREKRKTSVDYIKIWHFQACTLSNLHYSVSFAQYIYFLLPFSNFFWIFGLTVEVFLFFHSSFICMGHYEKYFSRRPRAPSFKRYVLVSLRSYGCLEFPAAGKW